MALRDRKGAEHPVRSDAGCRNTVFNALAQSGAEYIPAFLQAGVRYLRIEFLGEGAEECRNVLQGYQAVLCGAKSGRELWRELRLMHQLGVTRGALDRVRHPLTVL